MIKLYFSFITSLILSISLNGQNYWQQAIKYDMDIEFDHVSHQFSGLQKIKYSNNSPPRRDTFVRARHAATPGAAPRPRA